jgi:hypothetical protein
MGLRRPGAVHAKTRLGQINAMLYDNNVFLGLRLQTIEMQIQSDGDPVINPHAISNSP